MQALTRNSERDTSFLEGKSVCFLTSLAFKRMLVSAFIESLFLGIL